MKCRGLEYKDSRAVLHHVVIQLLSVFALCYPWRREGGREGGMVVWSPPLLRLTVVMLADDTCPQYKEINLVYLLIFCRI